MQIIAALFALGAFITGPIGASGAEQPASSLKIVVLEGEGAVNIIQQKTAVRPLIEVRDRNNVPVAGASVTFTIGGGGQSAAFAGGAQTLTVTTNAAGQAAASGLNAVGSGAFQVQVQAAYQGQVATAAISQTNFATAAAASQAGASAGTASGATGGAAGGGGGISATTIGIVGAVVAGGAVAATQVAGKSDSGDGDNSNVYNGPISGQLQYLSISTASTCTRTQTISGTIQIQLSVGATSGTANVNVTQTETSVTGSCIPGGTTGFTVNNVAVTNSGGAVKFSGSSQNGDTVNTVKFDGTLSGNTSISGTLGIDIVAGGTGTGNSTRGNGSTTMQVTLTK